MPAQDQWPLWEIFIRTRGGLSHLHVGSLHAADGTMAIESARDLYVRRQEGESIWAIPSAMVVASDPAFADPLFAPAKGKIYRHASFYTVPNNVDGL